MEGQVAKKLADQHARFEIALAAATSSNHHVVHTNRSTGEVIGEKNKEHSPLLHLDSLEIVLSHLKTLKTDSSNKNTMDWLSSTNQQQCPEVYALLGYSYELLNAITDEAVTMLEENMVRDAAERESLQVELASEKEVERVRREERTAMNSLDPKVSDESDEPRREDHIAPLARLGHTLSLFLSLFLNITFTLP